MPKQTFFNLEETKRQKIVDVAIDEFAEHDYRSASISRIVETAGIAKGSFYQYFEDKRDLYLYLVQLAGEQKAAYFNRHELPDPNMGFFDYLHWAFSIRVHYEVVHPKLTRIAYNAFYNEVSMLDEVMEIGKRQAAAFSQQLFARGIAQGDLAPDLDIELAAFIFDSVVIRLGGYLMERLDIKPQELLENDNFLFNRPEAEAIFSGVMAILEQGMGKK